MRIIVGLFLVFTLQSCFAQQTSPAGLQSLNSDVLVWAAAWRLPNTTSVASWDAFNNKALSAVGTAPTLLANPFNNSVPGVSFSGSQCMKSTTIGATDSLYSVYVAATLPGAGVHVLAAQEESVSVGYALILSHNGTTIELSFNMNGFPLGSVSAEAGLYIQGDPMLFWYSQDVSYGTLGFDTLSNSFSSDSTTLNTVTTAVGCDLKGDHLTGVVGEVLVLKTGGNNTAAHNIITNSLAARFGITGFPNKIYTGATDQNGNSKDDVSGIGSEPTGTVLSGNSVQLTVSRQTALPDGDYIMFGRVPDDGELFTFPLGNYTIFSRVWFVTVSVQGQINQQATADLSFDVSTVKDILSANDSSYFVVHQPTSSAPYQIIAQNGVVSADNNTVTFSGVSLSTGYLTVGSTVRSTPLPTPSSGPVAGPVAGPSAPIASAPVANAYPSPGIIRRSGAVGTAVSVFSAVMLIACLLF